MNSSLYDAIYAGLASSSAYRAALVETAFDLPEWVVPLSSVDRAALERIATEIAAGENDRIVDLACGLGGPGLWIAMRANACITGVDYSAVAIGEARRLAAALDMRTRATFVVADATRTGLTASAFDAVVSVDALQFMDAATAIAEIARILKPGGRAAITTWEALTDVEVPTVVRDYRPYVRSAGLTLLKAEVLAGARARELAHYRALLSRAQLLRAEMREGAEPLLHEAEAGVRREGDPPRVRKVLVVAEKRT